MDPVIEEKKIEKSCALCKKMDEVPEDSTCPKIWTCVIYAKPGHEYKHFAPREDAV